MEIIAFSPLFHVVVVVVALLLHGSSSMIVFTTVIVSVEQIRTVLQRTVLFYLGTTGSLRTVIGNHFLLFLKSNYPVASSCQEI